MGHEVPLYGGSLQLAARRTSSAPPVDRSVDDVLVRERAAGLHGTESLIASGRRVACWPGASGPSWRAAADAGRRIAAYGAPSKAAVLLTLADVDQRLLPYTVDLSPAKSGRRIPGAACRSTLSTHLLQDRPDDVVLLTWDIADEVAEQLTRSAAGTGWDPTLIAPATKPPRAPAERTELADTGLTAGDRSAARRTSRRSGAAPRRDSSSVAIR